VTKEDRVTDTAALPAPAPRPAPPGTPARLTRRQKAAVVVRILLDEGGSLALSELDARAQADLAEAMAGLSHVDRDTLRAVVREFLAELEGLGVAFPGGLDRALGLLEGHISAEAADRLRRAQGALPGADPWARLAALDEDKLLALIDEERPVVAAVVLSRLPTAKAAALLGRIEGKRAREIALAIPATAATGPGVVAEIGAVLARRLDAEPPRAFRDAPAERMGAILNQAPAATRDALLAELDRGDRDFAQSVRKAIFTFADIPDRVEPQDVYKLLKGIPADALVLALAAAETAAPEAARFLFENMSKRMAGQLREEVDEHGPVKRKEADAALGVVVRAVQDCVARGEVTLIARDDDEG
jgi:flagellar motor switch protein FliG